MRRRPWLLPLWRMPRRCVLQPMRLSLARSAPHLSARRWLRRAAATSRIIYGAAAELPLACTRSIYFIGAVKPYTISTFFSKTLESHDDEPLEMRGDNRKPDSFCGCCTSRVGIDRIYFGSTAKEISHLRQNTHTKKRPAREDPRILRESRALAVRINQTRQSKPSFVRSDGTRSLCRRVRTALLSSPLFTCSPHICLMQPRAGRERLRRAP